MEEDEGWSNLTRDLLENIGEKIGAYSDYVRFRAVCADWRSSLPENTNRFQQRFPCLLLPRTPLLQNTPPCLLNPLLPDVVKALPVQLPLSIDDLLIKGYSKGWLIAVERKGPSIFFINPFTNQIKQLPPVHTFPGLLDYRTGKVGEERIVADRETFTFEKLNGLFIRKIIVSSNNINHSIAMAICGRFSTQLAFCKYGDKKWTLVEDEYVSFYEDVIFHKDKFYVVNKNEEIFVVCNLDSSPATMRIAEDFHILWKITTNKIYLVESWDADELLLVGREAAWLELSPNVEDYHYHTTRFEVYKLKLKSCSYRKTKLKRNFYILGNVKLFVGKNEPSSTQTKLNSLGNHVLFLGQNESMCLPSHSFPCCKGGHIYFCDDYIEGQIHGVEGGSDIGVFDYNNNDLQQLPGNPHHHMIPVFPPPIWVMYNP